MGLQVPVTAILVAGIVVRGGHVGPGQCGDLVQECLSLVPCTHLASEEADITIGLQRLADRPQGIGAAIETVRPVGAPRQIKVAATTVRDQGNGIQAGAPLEVLRHLSERVPIRVQDHRFDPRCGAVDQCLGVGHAGVDEDDFVACLGRRRGGRRSGHFVNLLGGIVGSRIRCVGSGFVGGSCDGGAVKHQAWLQRQDRRPHRLARTMLGGLDLGRARHAPPLAKILFRIAMHSKRVERHQRLSPSRHNSSLAGTPRFPWSSR